MMKLSELIAHVGDDNVSYQTLTTDLKSANIFKSSGVISFNTSPKMVADMLKPEPEYIALVVWIPKQLLPRQ